MKKLTKFLSLAVAAALLIMNALPMNAIAADGDVHAVSGTNNSLITLMAGSTQDTPTFDKGTINVQMQAITGSDPTAYVGADFAGFKLLDITHKNEGDVDQVTVALNDAYKPFWNTMSITTIDELKRRMELESTDADYVDSEKIINAFTKYYYDLSKADRAALVQIAATAGATGLATFGEKPLGLYAILQTAAPTEGYVASAPLLVCQPTYVKKTETPETYEWQNVLTVAPKNDTITVDKKVKDASDDDAPMADEAVVGVGSTLDYEIIVKLPVYGTSLSKINSKVTDTLNNTGLDYKDGTLKVDFTTSDAEPSATTVWETANTAYYVNSTFDHTVRNFSVDFGYAGSTDNYMNNINGTYYYAKVSYQVVVTSAALTENVTTKTNEANLDFTKGTDIDDGSSKDTVKTYILNLDLTKYDSADKDKLDGATPLKYAEFTVTDNETTPNKIYFVETPTGTAEKPDYTYVAKYNPTQDEIDNGTVTNTIKMGEDGKAVITGLKEGSYLFTETQAPAGYTQQGTPIQIDVATPKDDKVAETAAGYHKVDEYDPAQNIFNTKGVTLPATGGVGTIVFTVVGIGLIAMAYLLVIKKKQVNK